MSINLFFLVFFFCLLIEELDSQVLFENNDHLTSIGISSTLGTHQNSIGFFLRHESRFGRWINLTQIQLRYNNKTYGPPIDYMGLKFSSAFHYQFGDVLLEELRLINGLVNYDYQNGVAYELSYFLNNIGTRQTLGAFSFRFNHFALLFQNDLFANFEGRDRFRTGAIAVGYVDAYTSIWLKNLIWTGETRCLNRTLVRDSQYPSKIGYKNIAECPYGKISHGILALQLNHSFSNWLNVGGAIGIDHEKIRHVFQNKVIHDVFKNPHIPMLDDENLLYLFKDDQRIRPGRFFFELSNHGDVIY